MAFIDLDTFGLEFKHLISGPAPVGRILNYVIASGKDILFHKNGERTLKLFNYKTGGIGSAWCTEFMVGLGLCYYDSEARGKTKLNLTNDGKLLFNKIKNFKSTFDENKDPSECRKELTTIPGAYDLFLKIFRKSIVCKNLVEYIIKMKKNHAFASSDFSEKYFAFFKKYYTGQNYIAESRTATTADNRVPSLIQLCKFFNLCNEKDGMLTFNFISLQSANIMAHYVDRKVLTKQVIKEKEIKKIEIDNLAEKFGIDGEELRQVLTRNSMVQKMFRNNLIASNGCECAICGKNLEEVLIASHIKPSCECDVNEKTDENNGLLLCANHDKLFDRHLISFDYKTGKIMYAAKLAGHLKQYELTSEHRLQDELLTKERAHYLRQHNEKFQEENAT